MSPSEMSLYVFGGLAAVLLVAYWVFYFLMGTKLVKEDKCQDTKKLGWAMVILGAFTIISVGIVHPAVSGLLALAVAALYFYVGAIYVREKRCEKTKKMGIAVLTVGAVAVVSAAIAAGVRSGDFTESYVRFTKSMNPARESMIRDIERALGN
uniref:Uncharacterized protein n=1 Tax=viral metagenome TaxID=1070528 RepID=A0A6C0CME9_9ZZZZ